MDGILVTQVGMKVSGQLTCSSTKLTIEDISSAPLTDTDGTRCLYTYNGTAPITGKANITVHLMAVTVFHKTTSSVNYTGVFIPDKTAPNKLAVQTLVLTQEVSATTTAKPPETTTTPANVTPATSTAGPLSTPTPPLPTNATLTIDYIYLQYEENPKKVVKNNNGGAVAVAIIEGIALIAILAYFGYKTMVDHKKKQATMTMAAMYGYENNSRITVPDTIRMSDIPPPRDTTYATPASIQPTPTRTVMTTSPELVVPTSSTSATTVQHSQNGGQFNDPFASLESW
ncbi:unnamed protein product [Caenorhabditis sp. 36 PRJEB53466]|nr:unnamed protein product [Caenorhabditis sp. 36 PRJEB53466]